MTRRIAIRIKINNFNNMYDNNGFCKLFRRFCAKSMF